MLRGSRLYFLVAFALSLSLSFDATAARRVVPIPCAFSRVSSYPLSTSEASLPQVFDAKILPFFNAGAEGTFAGVRGVPIHYRKFVVPNEKGAFVIATGFTESSSKYAELIHNLVDQGYSVYIVDHRGQGNSGRLVKNPARVHVEHFDDYVKDLHKFMGEVVGKDPHSNTTLLGISMGGLISTLYAEKYPNRGFDKLALVSPMFGINARGVPDLAMSFVGMVGKALGFGRDYVFGLNDMSFNKMTFETQDSTHSKARFDQKFAAWQREPHTLQGGNSFGWLERAIAGMFKARSNAYRLEMPVMVLQAGDDHTVRNSTHAKLVGRGQQGQVITFPGAWHDLLLETDEHRNPAVGHLLDFASPNYRFHP